MELSCIHNLNSKAEKLLNMLFAEVQMTSELELALLMWVHLTVKKFHCNMSISSTLQLRLGQAGGPLP